MNRFCKTNKREKPHRENWGTMRALQELRELSKPGGTSEYHCLHFPCSWITDERSIQAFWSTCRVTGAHPEPLIPEQGPATTGRHHSTCTRDPSAQRLIQQVLLHAPTKLCTHGAPTPGESRKLAKCGRTHILEGAGCPF